MDDFITRLFELNRRSQKEILANFEYQLRNHDWFYNLSDDSLVVRKGREMSKIISENHQSLVHMGLGEYADKLIDIYKPRTEKDLNKPLYKRKKKE